MKCRHWNGPHVFRRYDGPDSELSCRCGARHVPALPGFVDEARARSTDPETSHAAARSVKDLRSSQADVLVVLRRMVPMTDEELVETYQDLARSGFVRSQSPSGIRTRRSELVELGLVEDSGQRETLRSGRRAIVWKAREET